MRHLGEHNGQQIVFYGYQPGNETFLFSYLEDIAKQDIEWLTKILAQSQNSMYLIKDLEKHVHPVTKLDGFAHASRHWAMKKSGITDIKLYDMEQAKAWFGQSPSNFLSTRERRAAEIISPSDLTNGSKPVAPQSVAPQSVAPQPVDSLYDIGDILPPIELPTIIDLPGVTTAVPAQTYYPGVTTAVPAQPNVSVTPLDPSISRRISPPSSTDAIEESLIKSAKAIEMAAEKLASILDIAKKMEKLERRAQSEKKAAERKKRRDEKKQLNG